MTGDGPLGGGFVARNATAAAKKKKTAGRKNLCPNCRRDKGDAARPGLCGICLDNRDAQKRRKEDDDADDDVAPTGTGSAPPMA